MSPTCSNCFSRKCRCFYQWQKKLTEKDETEQNSTEQTETEQSEPTVQTEDNNESSDPAHYLLNYNSHFPNKTPILFPFQHCMDQKNILESMRNGTISVPSVIFPKYDENLTCKHGNHFNENDDFLSKVSDVVIVYDERGERIYQWTKIGIFYSAAP